MLLQRGTQPRDHLVLDATAVDLGVPVEDHKLLPGRHQQRHPVLGEEPVIGLVVEGDTPVCDLDRPRIIHPRGADHEAGDAAEGDEDRQNPGEGELVESAQNHRGLAEQVDKPADQRPDEEGEHQPEDGTDDGEDRPVPGGDGDGGGIELLRPFRHGRILSGSPVAGSPARCVAPRVTDRGRVRR